MNRKLRELEISNRFLAMVFGVFDSETGLLEAAAEDLNPGFLKRMREGLPYVRCKLGMSLDGRTAMASGESQWITAEAARRDVQRLRARSSAILTGIGTVLADDPSMNVRLSAAELPGVESDDYLRQPMRVILDARLRTPPRARLLSLPGQVLVVCGEGASAETEAELWRAAPLGQNRWRLDTRFFLGLDRRDIYVNPEVTFIGWEPHEIYAAWHYFDGDDDTIGGYWEDSALLTLGLRSQF